MKDVCEVLRHKEKDLERVRREIQALLTVIPLLADDQPIPEDVMHLFLSRAEGRLRESSDLRKSS
jgi:hypothetical protein